jgi:capsular polysaccharide biosynthesis protein
MVRLILLKLLETYFRHRWLFLLPILLMVGVSVRSFLGQKSVYIANGSMYIQQQSLLAQLTGSASSGFSWVTPAQATSGELKELLQTDSFVRAIIQLTDLEKEMTRGPAAVQTMIGNVRSAVWVQTAGDNLIQVGSAYGQAITTQQLVSATMEIFIQWKINSDRQSSVVAQNFFADLIQSYQADLDTARQNMQAYLDQHPDPVRGDRPSTERLDIAALQADIDSAAQRLASAVDKQESARLSVSKTESDVRQKYAVVDVPEVPAKPENSKKKALTNGLIFVVVGVLLAIVAVVGGATLDRSVRFPVDAQHGINLPVLAVVPDTSPRKKQKKGKVG